MVPNRRPSGRAHRWRNAIGRSHDQSGDSAAGLHLTSVPQGHPCCRKLPVEPRFGMLRIIMPTACVITLVCLRIHARGRQVARDHKDCGGYRHTRPARSLFEVARLACCATAFLGGAASIYPCGASPHSRFAARPTHYGRDLARSAVESRLRTLLKVSTVAA